MNEHRHERDPEPTLFVGIDWGSREHACCAIDPAGKLLWKKRIEHTPEGFRFLLDRILETASQPREVAVAIEDPNHPLVDWLLDHQLQVYAINPKQLDRFRERRTVAGAKDDHRDAFVGANSLRTDRDAFRKLAIPSPQAIAMRETSRRYDTLEKELRREASRLSDHLLHSAPNLLELCPSADEPFFFELLSLAPSVEAAKRLRPERITKLLRRHGKRKFKASEVLAILRAPRLELAKGSQEQIWMTIQTLLPLLQTIREQLSVVDKELAELCRNGGRDAEIIDSFPGAGKRTVVGLLAEAGQAIADRDLPALRTLAGTAPVTRRSGFACHVTMRRACSHRVRNACQLWAWNAVDRDPIATAHYHALKGQGHRHHRALRGVADRLLSRLIAALKADSLYEPPALIDLPAA